MLCATVRKSPWLQEIRMLDPERDCRRIVFLDTFLEFPFDTTRALELAFFKTLPRRASPQLLDSTGEFTLRGQKRYDDTDLLISAFSEEGWDGPLGRAPALRLFPPRRQPRLRTTMHRRSYPGG